MNEDSLFEVRENPIFKELTSILGNGFILSLFAIDFFSFEYILPLLGSIIMFYGCHLIRHQNTYFKRAYYISIARVTLNLFNFLVEWTSLYKNPVLIYFQITCSVLLICSLFYELNMAFKQFYLLGKISPYKNRLLGYLPIYLLTLLTTFLTSNLGVIAALLSILLLLINVIYIARSFYLLGETLSHYEIEVQLQAVEGNQKQLFTLLGGGYIIILIITIFFSNKGALFQSNSVPHYDEQTTQYVTTQNKLHDQGVNTDLILLLNTTDLTQLENMQQTDIQTSTHHLNGGELEVSIYNIKLTNDYRMIIYYRWIKEPSNRLFNILECASDNFMSINTLTSLCVFDEESVTKEIPTIHCELNEKGYPYTHQKISNDGTNLRGYLAFNYTPNKTINKTSFQINYYYQVSIFNLPYLNILDYMNHYELLSESYVHSLLSIPYHPKFSTIGAFQPTQE